ncbi:unnamed protein product [Didymodactylos carnosus]|uniref:Riboflavin transporter n=1 Tax=Didymodactylos carnosus TaxID=1234261 RepID=A0A815VYV6_9BILA|nr:unnamed protein product [Didymodactylos carnosus]CAF1535079.1 unnamed protein product [Didymodactylos carnosus]CAF4142878.1 unnamed protein product [Didymodactylos carnosus]CAF4394769.1 unnamed protein product [Didymodactylos carnosus]
MVVLWSSRLTYASIIILNLSTWIALQGVWMEFPLIIPLVPEGWSLPALMSLVSCLANISPLMIIIMRRIQGSQRFSEIPYIYALTITGILSCIIIGLFWNKTIFIFNQKRSVILIIATFFLSIPDCSSSLIYFDFMKRFRPKYLNAMFIGESLICFIPSLIAIAQGIGSEVACHGQEPSFSQPRFSVKIYFFILAGVITCSLISFILLRWTSIAEIGNALEKRNETTIIDQEQDQDSKQACLEETMTTVIQRDNKLSRRTFYLLLIISVINSFIVYGCLPSLITYSLLPYGQRVFYYCSLLAPMAYPLACCVHAAIKLKLISLIISSVINILCSLFVIYIAFNSPCPILHDTVKGGILVTFIWCIIIFIVGYVRIRIGNIIKTSWPKQNGLYIYGLTTQIGYCLGSIPLFFIINVFKLLKDREPCVKYCHT